MGVAQGAESFWDGGAGTDNYVDINNWSTDFLPQSADFEEIAIINDGSSVFLENDLRDTGSGFVLPGGLILGQESGDSGSLEIRSGGYLSTPANASANGQVVIGATVEGVPAGVGTLSVLPGGSLDNFGTSSNRNLFANALSTVNIGGASPGAYLGIATQLGLAGTTRVIGAGHTIETGDVFFSDTSTFIAEITSTSHSFIDAQGTFGGSEGDANLAGTLQVEFSNGFTPSIGDAWDLLQADQYIGEFATINTPVSPGGPGVVYQLAEVPGDGARNRLQLQLNRVLELEVNTSTGAVSMSSPSGVAIDIDGYSILSEGGQLSTDNADWSSLSDNSTPGWVEAFPTANALNELVNTSGGSLSVNSTVSLGSPFVTGQSPDLVFEYTTLDGGIFKGLITYVSDPGGDLEGDYNSDGVVDAADYTVWRDNLGTAFSLPNRGDGLTGNVGQADYLVWRDNFGQNAAPSAGQATPEPSAGVLLALGGLMAWRPAARRRSRG